jgi:hypothetical protein
LVKSIAKIYSQGFYSPDQRTTPDLGLWPSVRPSSQNDPTGLFDLHGPARPSLAACWHAVADRGARRRMLVGVVFSIADGDEGGLNMERRMRGVRKRGPLTPSLAVDGRQRGGAEQQRSVAAPGQGRRGGAPPRGT